MTPVTENELQELKNLINNRFEDLKGEFKTINSRFDELTDEVRTIDKKLDVYIAKTDERLDSIKQSLDDLKKQSEKQDNRLWLLISTLFLTLLGFLAKIAFFSNP